MTMTANSSNSANAWCIGFGGRENNYGASCTECGAYQLSLLINKIQELNFPVFYFK